MKANRNDATHWQSKHDEYWLLEDGIYYLFVKAITDTASNKSTDSFNDTFVIDNVTYHRFGPYIFDNISGVILFIKTDKYLSDGTFSSLIILYIFVAFSMSI